MALVLVIVVKNIKNVVGNDMKKSLLFICLAFTYCSSGFSGCIIQPWQYYDVKVNIKNSTAHTLRVDACDYLPTYGNGYSWNPIEILPGKTGDVGWTICTGGQTSNTYNGNGLLSVSCKVTDDQQKTLDLVITYPGGCNDMQAGSTTYGNSNFLKAYGCNSALDHTVSNESHPSSSGYNQQYCSATPSSEHTIHNVIYYDITSGIYTLIWKEIKTNPVTGQIMANKLAQSLLKTLNYDHFQASYKGQVITITFSHPNSYANIPSDAVCHN